MTTSTTAKRTIRRAAVAAVLAAAAVTAPAAVAHADSNVTLEVADEVCGDVACEAAEVQKEIRILS